MFIQLGRRLWDCAAVVISELIRQIDWKDNTGNELQFRAGRFMQCLLADQTYFLLSSTFGLVSSAVKNNWPQCTVKTCYNVQAYNVRNPRSRCTWAYVISCANNLHRFQDVSSPIAYKFLGLS